MGIRIFQEIERVNKILKDKMNLTYWENGNLVQRKKRKCEGRSHSGEMSRIVFIKDHEAIGMELKQPLLASYLLNIDCTRGTILRAKSAIINKMRFLAFGVLTLLG